MGVVVTVRSLAKKKFQKKSRPREDRRRDYSSDEDGRRSSTSRNRRMSGKRREQERRREHRLEREKERQRDSRDKFRVKEEDRKKGEERLKDRPRPPEEKAKEQHSHQDLKKGRKTIDSIYSAIYSDASEDGKPPATVAASSDGGGSTSSPEIVRKSTASKKKKMPGSRSSSEEEEEEEASMSSSDGSSSEAGMSSAAASSSAKKSSSEAFSPSSSDVSSSEKEAEEGDVKLAAKSKEETKAISQSASPKSSKSRSSSSSSKSSASESEDEEGDVDVEGTPRTSPTLPEKKRAKAEEHETQIEEERRKPVPVRKPSLTKTREGNEGDDDGGKDDGVFATPLTPSAKTNGGGAGAATATPAASVKIPEESPPHISDHCYAKPISSSLETATKKQQQLLQSQVVNDHGYTRPRTPPAEKEVEEVKVAAKPGSRVARRTSSAGAPKGARKSVLLTQQQQHPSVAAGRAARKAYKLRDGKQQFEVVYRFLTRGLDLEDIGYLKRSYEMMLDEEVKKEEGKQLSWLNDTTWVDHTVTDLPDPPKKKARRGAGGLAMDDDDDDDHGRRHRTGCARTEGFYKMDPREKMRTKYHLHRDGGSVFAGRTTTAEGSATKGKLQSAQSLSREARSAQRRQLAILGDEVSSHSDLLKFNQLKVRGQEGKKKRFLYEYLIFTPCHLSYFSPPPPSSEESR